MLAQPCSRRTRTLVSMSYHNFELNHDFELACLSMLMVIINPGFLSSAKRNFNNSSIMYSIHIIPQLSKKIKSFIDRSRSPGPLKKFPSDDHQGIYVRKTAFFCSKKIGNAWREIAFIKGGRGIQRCVWWNIPNLSQPNPLPNHQPHPVHVCCIYIIAVEPACMVHGCKVNPLVWSIIGWSQSLLH